MLIKNGDIVPPLITLHDTITLKGTYDSFSVFALNKTIGDFKAYRDEKMFNDGLKLGIEAMVFEDTCMNVGAEYNHSVTFNMPLPSGSVSVWI